MLEPWHDDRLAANGRAVKENFSDWFGDSKIVDKGGQPLVAYHGTGVNSGNRGEFISGNFDAFDATLSGQSSKTGAPEGTFFFTDKPDIASSYTVQWQGDFSETYKDNANVMPVYLAMSKPLKISAKGENWRDIFYKGAFVDVNDVAQMAKESGRYDGVIVSRVRDKGIGNTVSKIATTYIAFSPIQIKSTIGNNGLYLRDSASLTDKDVGLALRCAYQARMALEKMLKTSVPKVALC